VSETLIDQELVQAVLDAGAQLNAAIAAATAAGLTVKIGQASVIELGAEDRPLVQVKVYRRVR
jgi:hypothetical protein